MDIFREELAKRYPKYGYPLWEPDPGRLYDRVEVGDVGFFREGYFCRLFNALRPGVPGVCSPDLDDSSHPDPRHSLNYPPQLEPNTSHHIRRSIDNQKDFCSKNVTKTFHETDIHALG